FVAYTAARTHVSLCFSLFAESTTWPTNTPASFNVQLDEPLDATSKDLEVALVQQILYTKPLPATGFYLTACCNLVELQTFPSNIIAEHALGVRQELPVLRVLPKD